MTARAPQTPTTIAERRNLVRRIMLAVYAGGGAVFLANGMGMAGIS